MKLNTIHESLLVSAGLVALVSYSIAGPGASDSHRSSAGPGFSADNNPGVLGQTASGGTQFGSSSNPGTQGSAFGQSTAADAQNNSSSGAASESSSGAGASNASNGVTHASSTGLSNRSANANAAIGRGEERMVVTPDKGEASEKSESISKKPETSDPRFTSSLLDSGLPTEKNSATGGVSPIPSATASRGIDPVPRATVPSHRPSPVPRASPIPSARATLRVEPVPSPINNTGS